MTDIVSRLSGKVVELRDDSLIIWDKNGSPNQRWDVVVVGGNLITIRSATTGLYLNPFYESAGARIRGKPEPYEWRQISVPAGWFQFATTDDKYVWLVTGTQDGDPVILESSNLKGDNTQWGYEPGARVQ